MWTQEKYICIYLIFLNVFYSSQNEVQREFTSFLEEKDESLEKFQTFQKCYLEFNSVLHFPFTLHIKLYCYKNKTIKNFIAILKNFKFCYRCFKEQLKFWSRVFAVPYLPMKKLIDDSRETKKVFTNRTPVYPRKILAQMRHYLQTMFF